jgi:diadenosine tetraphosphate (Ap4A) HIT family hydrolase
MNNHFELDPRLSDDCHVIGQMDISQLLLLNNALVPWFVLVPRTSVTDLTDLSRSQQTIVLEEINLIAAFIKQSFPVSKLNIASIGNVVSQLHIHVVGRAPTDFCWPNVVWGVSEHRPYDAAQVQSIISDVRDYLGDRIH